jgi:hypothetical protein
MRTVFIIGMWTSPGANLLLKTFPHSNTGRNSEGHETGSVALPISSLALIREWDSLRPKGSGLESHGI